MTSDELNEMERLWRGRTPATDIARILGYSYVHVLMVASKDRDRFPYRKVQTPDAIRRSWAVRVREGHATVEEACIATGAHPETVKKWLRELR